MTARLVLNRAADRRDAYPEALRNILSLARGRAARREIARGRATRRRRCSARRPRPLARPREKVATRTRAAGSGSAASRRSAAPMRSARLVGESERSPTAHGVRATDGNHGRAVAWGARRAAAAASSSSTPREPGPHRRDRELRRRGAARPRHLRRFGAQAAAEPRAKAGPSSPTPRGTATRDPEAGHAGLLIVVDEIEERRDDRPLTLRPGRRRRPRRCRRGAVPRPARPGAPAFVVVEPDKPIAALPRRGGPLRSPGGPDDGDGVALLRRTLAARLPRSSAVAPTLSWRSTDE